MKCFRLLGIRNILYLLTQFLPPLIHYTEWKAIGQAKCYKVYPLALRSVGQVTAGTEMHVILSFPPAKILAQRCARRPGGQRYFMPAKCRRSFAVFVGSW